MTLASRVDADSTDVRQGDVDGPTQRHKRYFDIRSKQTRFMAEDMHSVHD